MWPTAVLLSEVAPVTPGFTPASASLTSQQPQHQGQTVHRERFRLTNSSNDGWHVLAAKSVLPKAVLFQA